MRSKLLFLFLLPLLFLPAKSSPPFSLSPPSPSLLLKVRTLLSLLPTLPLLPRADQSHLPKLAPGKEPLQLAGSRPHPSSRTPTNTVEEPQCRCVIPHPKTLPSTPERLDACIGDVSLASGDQSPGKEFRKPLCEVIRGVPAGKERRKPWVQTSWFKLCAS